MRNKVTSILLAMVLVLTSLAPLSFANANDTREAFGSFDIVSTTNAELYRPTSLQNGEIWTGKSSTYKGNGQFEIDLSAIGQKYRLEKPKPQELYDIVFVLDRSGSMDKDSKMGNL